MKDPEFEQLTQSGDSCSDQSMTEKPTQEEIEDALNTLQNAEKW